MSDEDSRAILLRRALFVSTALTAIGCSSQTAPTEALATETVTIPSGQPDRHSTSSSVAPHKTPRTKFSEVMKAAPPLTVSESLPEIDKRQLLPQAQGYAPIYEKLERLWDSAPVDCPLSKDSCVPEWERTMRGLSELEPGLNEPLCGPAPGERNGTLARAAAHRAFIVAQIAALRGELRKVAERTESTSVFESIGSGLHMTMRPCLQCIAPAPRVHDTVVFAVEDAALSPMALQALERVKTTLVGQPSLRVQVRGHVDSSEKGNRDALAEKRAKIVFDWLAAHGVPQAQIQTTTLGAELPVDTSATPEGRAANRRVDFQTL